MKVKNTKETADTWVGMMIEPNAYYTIDPIELSRWQTDSKVLTDLGSGDLVFNDDIQDILDPGTAINLLLQKDPTPRDSTGRPITRRAITNDGWHYQLHCLEFQTSKLGSIYNKDENGNDLGFGSVKLFKEDGSEITLEAEENQAVTTQVDWMTNHEMDIIGGQLYQAAPPVGDCRLWIIAAPGILNLKFGQGGINLKHAPAGGAVNADGRASKYLPPSPAGINKFRLIFKHPAGLQHSAMMLFELFKP